MKSMMVERYVLKVFFRKIAEKFGILIFNLYIGDINDTETVSPSK